MKTSPSISDDARKHTNKPKTSSILLAICEQTLAIHILLSNSFNSYIAVFNFELDMVSSMIFCIT